MNFKKVLSFLLAMLIAISVSVTGFLVFGEETAQPQTKMSRTDNIIPKIINIVYDDSGSMVNGDEKDVSVAKAYIDRWAQAKYSLETFISMLDDDDSLNVYTMSGQGKKYTTIEGKDKAKSVKKIHSDFKTGDYGIQTPISALDSAYKDLKSYGNEYEKWLIVLTDGAFTGSDSKAISSEKVSKTFDDYGKELTHNLIYIPIETSEEYVYKSKEFTTLTDSDGTILDRLQKAASLIYPQRDVTSCEVNGNTATIDTGGISMSKLIIFAQGSGAEIETIDSGKISENISVKYTEVDNAVNYSTNTSFKNHEDLIKTDKSLQGVVATVEPRENGGYITSDSSITVTFDDDSKITNCVVYFVPAVELQYSLTDSDGNIWLSSENTNSYSSSISPGEYVFKADIIDSGTKKGNLDKNVKLSPVELDVNINGNNYSINELQEGITIDLADTQDLSNIEAAASVMDGKYSVDTSDLFSAFSNTIVKSTYSLKIDFSKEKSASPLDFKFKKTDFILHSLNKIDKYEDMLTATVSCVDLNGNSVPLTNEIWQMVKTAYENGGLSTDGTSFYVGNPSDDEETNVDYNVFFEDSVTENDEGIFYVCPKYVTDKDGKTDKKHTTHQNFIHRNIKCNITAEINIPNVSTELAYSTTPTAIEDKSGTYAIAICMWYTIVSLFIFFWLLGYFVKKKFPRKKHGVFENKTALKYERDEFGEYHWVADKKKSDDTRKLVVNKFTKFLPYLTQKGRMDLEFSNLPSLEFKATFNRNRVKLINSPKDFGALSPKATTDKNNKFIVINETFLTEKNVEEEQKGEGKFIFDLPNSFIRFGGAESSSRYKSFEITEFEK